MTISLYRTCLLWTLTIIIMFFNFSFCFGLKDSQSFTIESCGGPDESIKINNFIIMPDPIIVPGTVVLSFTMENSQTLYQPISLDYKIEKQIGDEWFTVPCTIIPDSTCYIDDVCQSSIDLPLCPKQVEEMIPCKCPLQKNNYTLEATQIPIFMSGTLIAGRYRARVKANNWMYGEVLCYNINAEVVSAEQLNQ